MALAPGPAMTPTLAGLVARYGYATVAGIITLEGIGLPVPGETILITAAAVAARGELSILGVVLAAFAGVVLGGSGGYWIGRAGGLKLLRRHGKLFHMDAQRLDRAHHYFERHGAWTVFIARFVALLRMLAGVLAGVGCMGFARYSVANAAGGLAWAGVFGALGYEFGTNLPLLERYGARASLVVALLVAIVAGLVILWRRFGRCSDALWGAGRKLHDSVVARPLVRRELERHPRLWRFVAARFAPGEYLGLHLTLGLLISLAALWLFGGITEDVIHHDPLTRFDLSVLQWFQRLGSPAGDRVAVVVSLVGSPVAMVVVALLGALLLAWRRLWLVFVGWVVAFGGGGVLDAALKLIVRRPRPPGATAFLHGMTFSFPSGHSMGSLIGYGMLAYVVTILWVRHRAGRIVVVAATAVLVLAIGTSRLYLGVHYFSDVVGGYAAGVLWLAACVSGVEVAREKRKLAERMTGGGASARGSGAGGVGNGGAGAGAASAEVRAVEGPR